jgi:hypothetical protein
VLCGTPKHYSDICELCATTGITTDKLDVFRISKFDGHNFHQWKFQLNCALKDVFNVATGITPKLKDNEAARRWTRDDATAMFIITSSMEISQITLVKNCQSLLEIMRKLD